MFICASHEYEKKQEKLGDQRKIRVYILVSTRLLSLIYRRYARANNGQGFWLVSIIKYVKMITCQVQVEASLIR